MRGIIGAGFDRMARSGEEIKSKKPDFFGKFLLPKPANCGRIKN